MSANAVNYQMTAMKFWYSWPLEDEHEWLMYSPHSLSFVQYFALWPHTYDINISLSLWIVLISRLKSSNTLNWDDEHGKHAELLTVYIFILSVSVRWHQYLAQRNSLSFIIQVLTVQSLITRAAIINKTLITNSNTFKCIQAKLSLSCRLVSCCSSQGLFCCHLVSFSGLIYR